MHFELTAKQAIVRRTVKRYAEERLAPIAAEMDRSAVFPHVVALEMAALNYFGLEVPLEFGGAGLDSVSCAVAVEEVSKVSGAMGLCISVHNSVAVAPVYRCGTEDQRRRFLAPMVAGRKIGAFCLTEPNAGSDASSLETTAVRDGNDYVLNGNKVFVTNGGVSGINLVFAVAPGSAKGRGLSAFLVESDREGLEKGPVEDLMGMRGNPVCPISLTDCRVPAENLLGQEGEGLKIAMTALSGGRIGIGAQALGIAQAALDASVKYAEERRQFGKALFEFGAVQNFLAEMATRIDAARLLVYRAAQLREKGLDPVRESAMAKLFAGEAAVDAARMGVQIHGGYGYTKAYPIERLYRDAKVCEIYEGTSEIQRIVIARSLQG